MITTSAITVRRNYDSGCRASNPGAAVRKRLRAVMKRIHLAVVVLAAAATLDALQSRPPRDWVDPATGHRVVRLTDDAGGSTLYFHDNAFSPEGDKLMFTTPRGMAVVDVAKIGQ